MSDRLVFVTLHVRRSQQAVPLAAATLAASLPPSWYQRCRLLDFYLDEPQPHMAEQILAQDPCLVSFSLYVWNRQQVLELAGQLRRQQPELALVVGGPEASADAEALRHSGVFDVVCEGEGEPVLGELVAALGQPFPLAKAVPESCPPVDFNRHVSPWLSRLLPVDQGVLWEVSRGCPFNCAFCFDARGASGVRPVPFERLAQELELFVRQGVSQIWVLDSTFNYPAERGRRLLQLIAEKAPHIHFHLEAKAEYIDVETVELLQQISCSVQVGLQSARPEVLRHIRRALDPQVFQQNVALLAEAGITFGVDLMYGLPGDDYQGLCDSLTFVLELRPNQIEIFPLALLPGTELYRQRERFGLQAETHPPYRLLSSDSITPAQLQQCRRLAAVTNLFYNTGRAMGYFLELCQGVDLTPLELLQRFETWLGEQRQIDEAQLLADDWSAAQSLALQLEFVADYLQAHGQENLLAVTLDVIRFHHIWADTVLAPEVLPADPLPPLSQWLLCCWQLSQAVTVADFSYDVQEYYHNSDIDLVEQAEFSEPLGSTGLFARRHNEVICLSIEPQMADLLRHCDGTQTPPQIVSAQQLNITPQQLEEWVQFAVSEGVLLPA